MSGFEKALRGLSAGEMLECASALLKCLTGAGSGARRTQTQDRAQGALPRRVPSDGGVSEPVRTRRDVSGAAALLRERSLAGVRAPERGVRGSGSAGPADRGRDAPDSPDAPRSERGRQIGIAGPVRTAGAEADGAAAGAAAFSGPELRYENAAGARGAEMGRVSDYFRRDSRRYDAGFTRY